MDRERLSGVTCGVQADNRGSCRSAASAFKIRRAQWLWKPPPFASHAHMVIAVEQIDLYALVRRRSQPISPLLFHDPGRHTSDVLHIRGLKRIGQRPTQRRRQVQKCPLVDHEAF